MAISSAGIGSNLDVSSIVSQLMALEQRPLTALQKKEAVYQGKISALGSLKSALSALQTSASSLIPASGTSALQKFSSFKTSVADTTIATASASSSAVAGTYTLSNIVLASAQQVRKTGIVVPATAGSLNIQVGTAAAVTINLAAGSTLANVVDAINGSTAGISAAIVNSGSAEHLILTAKDTGTANTIAITGSDGDGGTAWASSSFTFTGTNLNNGWTESATAKNATLDINTIAVSSASNTLSSAISGVTLNLLKAGSTTLSVTRDTSSVAASVNAFVKAYNDFNTTANNLGSYNATTKQAGTLNGDSTLRSAQGSLRSLVMNAPAELSDAAFQRLSDIGVSMQKDGSLTVDSAKLSTAVSSNLVGVANLLSVYGSAFKAATDGMIGSSGTIVARTEGISASIKSITKQAEAVSDRLTQIETRYRKQFTALDTLIAGMTKTSNFLTQQLANLPKSGSLNN